MSYILDALKKSERQRKQGDVPDLQTVHMAAIENGRSNIWLYAVIVLLLISLAFLLGVYQPWALLKKNTGAAAEKAAIAEKIPEKPTLSQPEIIKPESRVEKQQRKPAEKKPDIIEVPGIRENIIEKEIAISQQEIRQVPGLSELPPDVQQAIPNMVFAGHVYSSNPAQRSIIINGYAMSEGDVVVGNLKVKQITRDGVIFDYQSQLFRVNILQDWSFD